MSTQRSQRVGELIRYEISEIVRLRIKDPRVGFVTFTRVDVSTDLRYAKVYVASPGDAEALKQSVEILAGAAGFIRSELFKRLTLRLIPELSFRADRSIEHGVRISQVLKELKEKEKGGQGES